MQNDTLYAAEIAEAVGKIKSREPDDYNVVSNYRIYRGKYQVQLANALPNVPGATRDYYIRREAYRRVANERGYSDDVLDS